MAKLKAPLMSLGASGALGKSLVFFSWKGLDVVREFVVPANPKSTLQLAQRARLTAAVAAIHTAEGVATVFLDATDKTAYALYGGTYPTPRTWFNQMTERWIIALVNSETPQILAHSVFTDPATTEITLELHNHHVNDPGFMHYGTSPTALSLKVAADGVANKNTGVVTGLVKGTKYYFQYRPTKVTDDKYVMRSGIYHHVCT